MLKEVFLLYTLFILAECQNESFKDGKNDWNQNNHVNFSKLDVEMNPRSEFFQKLETAQKSSKELLDKTREALQQVLSETYQVSEEALSKTVPSLFTNITNQAPKEALEKTSQFLLQALQTAYQSSKNIIYEIYQASKPYLQKTKQASEQILTKIQKEFTRVLSETPPTLKRKESITSQEDDEGVTAQIYRSERLIKANPMILNDYEPFFMKDTVIIIPGLSDIEENHQDNFLKVFANAFSDKRYYEVIKVLIPYEKSSASINDNIKMSIKVGQTLSNFVNSAREDKNKKLIVIAEDLGTIVAAEMSFSLKQKIDILYGIDQQIYPSNNNNAHYLRQDMGVMVSTINDIHFPYSYTNRDFYTARESKPWLHYKFFADVIQNNKEVPARFCSNHDDYINGKCNNLPKVNLWNTDTHSEANGTYFYEAVNACY